MMTRPRSRRLLRLLWNACTCISIAAALALAVMAARSYSVGHVFVRKHSREEPGRMLSWDCEFHLTVGYIGIARYHGASPLDEPPAHEIQLPFDRTTWRLLRLEGPELYRGWFRELPASTFALMEPKFSWKKWLGVLYVTSHRHSRGIIGRGWQLQIPAWYVVGILMILPAVRLVRLVRRRRRLAARKLAGACLRCGYDLRATPDRCPECGHGPTGVTEPTERRDDRRRA